MPTYEYECTKCKYKFEEFQKITDKPLLKCPKCKGKLRRLITGGAGIILKGSGFYVTDYKKKNLPQPKKEEKKDLKKYEDKAKTPAKTPPKSTNNKKK
jgi:putative FmdB family regulatory protein